MKLTSLATTASQPVGFFSVTEPVDEGSQLTHVPNASRHHHLLLNDVGLGQIHPPLQKNKSIQTVTWDCRLHSINTDTLAMMNQTLEFRASPLQGK